MKVLQYKGISFTSWLIRKFTRSLYSHSAIEFADGTVFEAWHVGNKGVRFISDFSEGHKPGTRVDVFEILKPVDEYGARAYCQSLVNDNAGYSWRAIARFVTRRSAPNDADVICSEVARDALRGGGVDLFNDSVKSALVSPGHIGMSAQLRKTGERITGPRFSHD